MNNLPNLRSGASLTFNKVGRVFPSDNILTTGDVVIFEVVNDLTGDTAYRWRLNLETVHADSQSFTTSLPSLEELPVDQNYALGVSIFRTRVPRDYVQGIKHYLPVGRFPFKISTLGNASHTVEIRDLKYTGLYFDSLLHDRYISDDTEEQGGGGGGSGSGTVFWFPSVAERDAYFVSNPTSLKQGISCGVGNPVTAYTYDGQNWLTGALAFAGPSPEMRIGGDSGTILQYRIKGESSWIDLFDLGTQKTTTYEAAETINGNRFVALTSENKIITANYANPYVFGWIKQAVSAGSNVEVFDKGAISNTSWSFTTGLPLFLANDGQVAQTRNPTEPLVRVGNATSATTFTIDIESPIFQ